MRKGFKVELGEEGLKSVRKELGVEVEDITEESVAKSESSLLEKYDVKKGNMRDMEKRTK